METESILLSVKKLLGIEPDYTQFDPDIIMNINAALQTLMQIGVGPETGFFISGVNETYKDYLGNDSKMQMVKMYLFYKTKLGFDPPQSTAVMECLKEMIRESEYRLNLQVDPVDTFG